MPINGGTRMLRARRKDINVKPNRRLDRKSSRGMLFENEELRMRTITINAEVEQGQHALKKLRRENEQLRREMWSLRDEYDKMEKLLRKKGTDEDSDQENSYSDDNYSQSEASDEDEREGDDEDGAGAAAEEESPPSASKFGNAATARAFDGLSVIDEQTEETTTESVAACPASRGSSSVRVPRAYDADAVAYATIRCGQRRRGAFDGAADWTADSVRPASPYPYSESLQPSYQKRFEALQSLNIAEDGSTCGWLLPDRRTFDYVIRDRAGPDVFISETKRRATETGIVNVEAEMDKIEISEKGSGGGGGGGGGGEVTSATVRCEPIAAAAERGEEKEEVVGVEVEGDRIREPVPCQDRSRGDVRKDHEADMARADKASTFQSKLVVTLKTPQYPPPPPPRSYQPSSGYDYHSPDVRFATFEPRFATKVEADENNDDDDDNDEEEEEDVLDARHIPLHDGLGLLTDVRVPCVAPLKAVKIPPAPPPRTTSCLGTIIPEAFVGARQRRGEFGGGARFGLPEDLPAARSPFLLDRNPLALSEPAATSSPTFAARPLLLRRGPNLSLDNLSRGRRPYREGVNEESSTEDVSVRKRCPRPSIEVPHLNKSVSSPSFGTFLRRKASEHSVSSFENGGQIFRRLPAERKGGAGRSGGGNPQNNVSVSSSSGLDSPTKSTRRKRRVSIKFNKKSRENDDDDDLEERGRRDSALPGILNVRSRARGKVRARNEETDATASDRERTNSVSSRASSSGLAARKLSSASNRTYLNDDKIPWCGCWGNGCV